MDCTKTLIPYSESGYFTKIILDYLNQSPELRPFYHHEVSLEGIQGALSEREKVKTDRSCLVQALSKQYQGVSSHPLVEKQIQLLQQETTFTVTTAHQPNIFTGYLYFIYKILHTIKLAEYLNNNLPGKHIVPVYYMGSEDADLEELGKIFLNGEKIVWDTSQKGAVGRMKTAGIEKLLVRLQGQFGVLDDGKKILDLIGKCYLESDNIQTATFKLVHALFAGYGLVVLIPDAADLKKQMIPIFEDDLLRQTPSQVVEKSIEGLSAHYKVQANPREINLFYLKDDIRNRISKSGDQWSVVDTSITFTEAELKKELHEHPERFSPNVILRGLYQETILPNLVFIGGGGELAYWLELKTLFQHYSTPYPVLMLRNSILFIEKKWKEKMTRLELDERDILKDEKLIADHLVKKNATIQLELTGELEELNDLYLRVQNVSKKIDQTLVQHVSALQARSTGRLKELEKKMIRAEKRKFSVQLKQVHEIKEKLFPRNSLQERIDNFIPYYAQYGEDFIHTLYEASPAINNAFLVLTEK